MKTLPNDTLLTLVIPVSLEEDILDFLLLHPQLASGFSILAAQGMGQGAPLQSAMELVQGRSARKLVLIAGRLEPLQQLVQRLGEEMPTPDVAYWMTPLLASGRLA
ncbi:DUF3240 domain-containing protein [Pseudoduganella sp. DS3]|uniref:DUF3240 domain-containing protein n=1 Tax=Pseudoduganella guangdongensis TaxID=2692179 RepID=A0A6N9HBJ9_9BURK|nr:DUF3240 family protein [Pseudoduganella guangdongensis]MYN00849.1 DUF3240 domain-containing protein [Pseudoduganella guangdongensis]